MSKIAIKGSQQLGSFGNFIINNEVVTPLGEYVKVDSRFKEPYEIPYLVTLTPAIESLLRNKYAISVDESDIIKWIDTLTELESLTVQNDETLMKVINHFELTSNLQEVGESTIENFFNLGTAKVNVQDSNGNFGGLLGNGDTYYVVLAQNPSECSGMFFGNSDDLYKNITDEKGNMDYSKVRYFEMLMVGTDSAQSTQYKQYFGMDTGDMIIRHSANFTDPLILKADGSIQCKTITDLKNRLQVIEQQLGIL